ncbi:hypothetical protein RND81_07G050100 [Saponaria officinalis]|uniref:Uncharacterized protein n=1 Tax=Saponaria officinalis TaxID=3572 RepID=A0AAW1JNA5_SAPOF
MARTTKLLALANVAFTRTSNRHGVQLYYINQATVITTELEHEDQKIEDVRNERVQFKKQSHKKAIDMNWVPHPRSGIYFPQGHDWVMDDVPCNAATLGQGQTYWLRNIDGVDKHDPDISSADQYFLTSRMRN